MKNLLLIYLFLGLSLNLSSQTILELKASRDASLGYHDYYNTADRNYGNAIQNAAYYIPGYSGGINSNRALIDFDLSSVPSGAIVSEATINLYAFKDYPEGTTVENGHFGNNTSYLRRVISTWDEYTATWNMQPQTTSENQIILHKSNHGNEDYINIDVTALVIDMLENPTESNGFMLGLMQEKEYANLSFYSKEGTDSTKYPVLKIIFQAGEEDQTDPSEPDETDPSDTSDEDDIGAIPQEPEVPLDPLDFDFIIYPNPGRKVLKIEFKDHESKQIMLYTMEGKIIFSLDSKQIIQEIVVRDLSPGIYFVQCSNEFKTITRKYVKMAR